MSSNSAEILSQLIGGLLERRGVKTVSDMVTWSLLNRLSKSLPPETENGLDLVRNLARRVKARSISRLEILKQLRGLNRALEKISLVDNIDAMVANDQWRIRVIDAAHYGAYRKIQKIFASAKKEIYIFDGYIGREIFDYFAEVDANLGSMMRIRILAGTIHDKAKFETELAHFQHTFKWIEVRESDQVHDRFAMVDGRAFIMGASIKDIAKKRQTYLVQVPRIASGDLIKWFGSVWQRSRSLT